MNAIASERPYEHYDTAAAGSRWDTYHNDPAMTKNRTRVFIILMSHNNIASPEWLTTSENTVLDDKLHGSDNGTRLRDVYFCTLENFVTDFVPSDIACLDNSPGRISRTLV